MPKWSGRVERIHLRRSGPKWAISRALLLRPKWMVTFSRHSCRSSLLSGLDAVVDSKIPHSSNVSRIAQSLSARSFDAAVDGRISSHAGSESALSILPPVRRPQMFLALWDFSQRERLEKKDRPGKTWAFTNVELLAWRFSSRTR
jgi:hypothetical protein